MINILENISLKSYNTFGINVSARYFVEIHSENDLLELIQNNKLAQHPFLILGGGSNILLTKDFDGLVIKNNIKGIEKIKEDENYIYIKAKSGEVWHEFVMNCVGNNYAGVENMSLIPGSVGAAPMQNIGAYGVEIKDTFESLEAINIQSGAIEIFINQDCHFGYRESIFKHSHKGKYIITSVTFRLSKHPEFKTTYGAIEDQLKAMNIQEMSIKAISDAVIAIRQSKLPDPKELGNSGSFFKNPVISESEFEIFHQKNPNAPFYKSEQEYKIPAGWLIEQCGWKGKIVGNTGAHKNQALVLVNYGNATGDEIWNLALEIQKSVKEKFNITIEPEVNVI